jgi:hypothetical protein
MKKDDHTTKFTTIIPGIHYKILNFDLSSTNNRFGYHTHITRMESPSPVANEGNTLPIPNDASQDDITSFTSSSKSTTETADVIEHQNNEHTSISDCNSPSYFQETKKEGNEETDEDRDQQQQQPLTEMASDDANAVDQSPTPHDVFSEDSDIGSPFLYFTHALREETNRSKLCLAVGSCMNEISQIEEIFGKQILKVKK